MDTLRKANQTDISVLKQLYNYFIAEMSCFDPIDSSQDEEIMLWIEGSLVGESSVIFVAEDDAGINGFARIQHKERISDIGVATIHYAKLSDLYVAAQSRRKGIAGLLIKASIDWARSYELSEIVLNVYQSNEAACTLYKAIGFNNDCAISDNRIRMKYCVPKM